MVRSRRIRLGLNLNAQFSLKMKVNLYPVLDQTETD